MSNLEAIQNLAGSLNPEAARGFQNALDKLKQAAETGPAGDAASFPDLLSNLLTRVDEAQKQADESIRQLAAGDSVSIQDVVLRMEEADLTFRLMKEIRDKLISAYKEVMTMQG
jgi:flagellar hook-basal body complex protein FliE